MAKLYRSKPREVTAEPMIEHDWYMSIPYIPGMSGGPRDGYRKGFKITDAKGQVSWMAKEEFEEQFEEKTFAHTLLPERFTGLEVKTEKESDNG